MRLVVMSTPAPKIVSSPETRRSLPERLTSVSAKAMISAGPAACRKEPSSTGAVCAGVGQKYRIARGQRRPLIDLERFADEEDAKDSGDSGQQANQLRSILHHGFLL